MSRVPDNILIVHGAPEDADMRALQMATFVFYRLPTSHTWYTYKARYGVSKPKDDDLGALVAWANYLIGRPL